MKLKPTADIPSFLRAVRHCRANVCFITQGHDELNLKSTLSQFVFIAVCAGGLSELQGSIIVEDPQDAQRLAEYLAVS